MSSDSRGRRIIDALNKLRQFGPARRSNDAVAVNVLNGATVTPVLSDDENDDSGLLFVRFPGGESIEVNGDLYLELQITVSARLIIDGPGDGRGAYSKQSAGDVEQLRRKHNLG